MNRSKLPDFADRLSTANEARKAQLERAKALAERPEGAERRKEREAIVAARNLRIDEHKAAEAARKEREAADRAAAEAAEATAISACRKIVRLVRPMPPAVKDYETLPEVSQAMVTLAAIRLMLHRLAHPNRRRLPAP